MFHCRNPKLSVLQYPALWPGCMRQTHCSSCSRHKPAHSSILRSIGIILAISGATEKANSVRRTDIYLSKIMQDAQMAASTGRNAASRQSSERQLRAGRVGAWRSARPAVWAASGDRLLGGLDRVRCYHWQAAVMPDGSSTTVSHHALRDGPWSPALNAELSRGIASSNRLPGDAFPAGGDLGLPDQEDQHVEEAPIWHPRY